MKAPNDHIDIHNFLNKTKNTRNKHKKHKTKIEQIKYIHLGRKEIERLHVFTKKKTIKLSLEIFTYLSTHSLRRPCINQSIHRPSIHSPTHPHTYPLSVCPSTIYHPPTHPHTYSLSIHHLSVHLSVHPSNASRASLCTSPRDSEMVLLWFLSLSLWSVLGEDHL